MNNFDQVTSDESTWIDITGIDQNAKLGRDDAGRLMVCIPHCAYGWEAFVDVKGLLQFLNVNEPA